MDAANRCLAHTCMPAFNEEFARQPPEQGSAFVPCKDLGVLDDILCEHHKRNAGKDNCIQFERLALQLPTDRHRRHYIKAKVKVLRYADGTLSVHYGPRRLARYDAKGQILAENAPVAA